ncbi:probable indole-3-pyruvate monooxygenase YUCCA4 [Prosopis cineraria]|uniref:probable indole-3-pyruvate monooxygenase YUCCA4 n=1 Tax=Prosopis cineraria TaxID=364024 RepID=UPI00240F0904|nr:probable indole-3-pyruvate monooxygenase YUCCA4 [Prosopis cineraria]
MASCKSQVEATECVWVQGPIIVGAGPSGLAVAACLSEQYRAPSLVLERCDCIASLWKTKTYDRLKLHLPKQFCELPLMGFPANYPKYPNKYQFISYLDSYASRFSIRPKFNQSVHEARFDPASGLWIVRTQDLVYVSRWLVVATGENAEPFIPKIVGIENFHGPIVHTTGYRSGTDYKNKKVLVIGCGNSGMEVSLDLCNHNARPYLVVRNTVHVLPREMFGFSTFGLAMTLIKWLPLTIVDKILILLAYFIIGNTDHYGIRRPKTGPMELKCAAGKSPVLDVGALEEIKAGKIKVVDGVKEITRNGAKMVNGQEKEFDAIILATGYRSNVPSWLKSREFFTSDGMPKTPFPSGWKGGNGLYAAGFSRRGILGAASDAVNIARDIADQWRNVKDHKSYREPQIILADSP